jgi:sulfate adenylyltransferase subunit 1 (EFTu-like GTPase family)
MFDSNHVQNDFIYQTGGSTEEVHSKRMYKTNSTEGVHDACGGERPQSITLDVAVNQFG